MKLPQEDFEEFQKYFKEYQDKFCLNGYQVYFKFKAASTDAWAEISIDQKAMVATLVLNSKLYKHDEQFKDIKKTARHEALHLLLHRLEARAKERYITNDEINEATEEIVVKLEKLLE